MATQMLKSIHPGEVLLEEFLKPLGMSAYRVAQGTGLPQTRLSEIIKGKRGITADTAIRLGRFFSVTPQFWLNIQAHYDLEQAAAQRQAAYNRIHAYDEGGRSICAA